MLDGLTMRHPHSFVMLERLVELLSSNFEYVDLHTENPKACSSGTALMRPLRCALDRDSASTAHAAATALSRLVSMLSRMSPASLARFLGDRARATVASCFSSVGMSSRWQEKKRGRQSVLAYSGVLDQPRRGSDPAEGEVDIPALRCSGWLASSFGVSEATIRIAVVASTLPGNSVSAFS